MNNQTETIRDAARKEICIMFGGREITPEINSIISQFCNGATFGANWQKEQDEAKYKALLESHNELLRICDHFYSICMPSDKKIIDKAKNI